MVPNLTEAEVQKALKEHENRMILKFNTCLILMKNVESIVKNATDVWRDVYHLHKPSKDLVEIKDDESDKEEDDEDDNTPSVTVTTEEMQDLMKDREEEKKEEAEEEDNQEEEDPMRISLEVIASLPHSPPKSTISSVETASTSMIMSTTATSTTQSSLATLQL